MSEYTPKCSSSLGMFSALLLTFYYMSRATIRVYYHTLYHAMNRGISMFS